MSDSPPGSTAFDAPPAVGAAAPPPRSMAGEILGQAPYILMLAGAFGGVAYTAFADTPNPLYWMILAPLFGLLCVAAGWEKAPERGGRMRLVWTQAGHWAAFLAAMLMLFLPSLRGVVNDNATEIALLLLLGLGTLVAGIHAGSWRIVAVGLVLGASVPAVALLQASAVMIAAGAVLVALLGAVFVFARAQR